MRIPVRIFLIGCALAVANTGSSAFAASYAPGGPVVLRDNKAAQFLLTPPDPVAAHPQVIQPDTQIEPSIAVNPQKPLNAVAGFQEGRVAGGGDETNGYATTFDGGKTWQYGELPGLTYLVGGSPFDRASDAAIAFGPDNLVYANSLVFNDSTGGGTHSGIATNVSKDGGATWSAPVFLENDNIQGSNDKNWITVDNSSASGHHKGRVYVTWDRGSPVVYSYCDANCDQLSNWLPLTAAPIQFYPLSPGQGISSTPLVLLDGSLGVAFTSGANVVWALALNAGMVPYPAPLTFTQTTITVATQTTRPIRYQRSCDSVLIMADVDPVTGKIYITWSDSRFRTESPSVVEDPVIVSSTNNDGLTWGPVQRIDYNAATNDYVNRYCAAVAVGTDSVVHVMWRQRQEDANAAGNGSTFSPTIDTFYQESHDAGATFTAPLMVDTSQSTNFYYGAFSRSGLFEGDYNQLGTSGPYTYIVREEAYPTSAGEPPGLKFSGGVYTADTSACPNPAAPTPGCLTHLHQRTWVAVLGPQLATNVPETPQAWWLALVALPALLAVLRSRRSLGRDRSPTPR
jgi:hypothetical protein